MGEPAESMMSLDSYAANGCIVCTRSLTAPIKDVRMGEENQWNVTTDLLVLVVIVVISCVKYRERAEVRGVVFSATCFSPRLKDRQREAWLTTGSPSRHNRIGRLFLFFPTHRSTLISIGGKWTLFYLIIIFNDDGGGDDDSRKLARRCCWPARAPSSTFFQHSATKKGMSLTGVCVLSFDTRFLHFSSRLFEGKDKRNRLIQTWVRVTVSHARHPTLIPITIRS